ncbi:hypothetical protein ACFY7H_00105 [Streptomyces sp. NPDC012794]|uniref:hypothetical protein n=1 Tax=Streptomyces sp. NPDC012794 TaxID=3364850 RepID=UPI0036A84F49
MDPTGLNLEAALADPRAAAEWLQQVESDAQKFTDRVRLTRTKFEALAARSWSFPQRSPSGTPSGSRKEADSNAERPQDTSQQNGPADGQQRKQPRAGQLAQEAGAAAGVGVPWRVRVLRVLDADSDPAREWTVREISEATGRPNHRSMRLLLQELVAEGLLTRRTELPRSVFYRRALPARSDEEGAIG